MKNIRSSVFLIALLICFPIQAQLVETVKNILTTAKDSIETVYNHDVNTDSTHSQTERLLQEAKINEMNLRMEIEQLKLASFSTDSLKQAAQKQRIDSLRNTTKGVPVIVDNDTLFTLYAKRGGLSPQERAEGVEKILLQLGKKYRLKPDSVYIESSEYVTDIMYGSKVIMSLTDMDALWKDTTKDKLAKEYRVIIVKELHQLQEAHSILQLIKRIFYFSLFSV